MPMTRLVLKPTIDVEKSASLNEGGYSLSNLIRWKSGLVEALLGWSRAVTQALTGVTRAIYYFADLVGNAYYAIGTNQKLYALPVSGSTFGALTDITPVEFIPGLVSTTAGVPLLIWSLDNFGGSLVACPSGQGIFTWTTGQPLALKIAAAPAVNTGLIVLDQAQIIMAWGCGPLSGGATPDPLLVRWCDSGDFTSWTASTTNQAGSFRIPRGTKIIGGLQVPGMALLWTDQSVWMVQYIGFPLVFSFQVAGTLCGLIAQKAIATMGPAVYWMSDHGFFRLVGGTVQQIPCPVWDQVFKNLDETNADKCLAGPNYHYSEVWWFYPSKTGGGGEIDSYVKLNVESESWDFGPATSGSPNAMSRTAWTDLNERSVPLAADLNKHLQMQDTGFTADGAAISGYIQSGYSDIAQGGELVTVDQFIPDFLWDGTNPSLQVSLYFRKWPGDTPTVMGPFTITPTTEYVTLRSAQPITVGSVTVTAYPAVRAREVAIRISTVSGWWRQGALRLRQAPSGRV